MKTFIVLLIAFILFPIDVFAQLPARDYHGQTVWQLPKVTENDIDIGLWALVIAKEFDNSIDIPKYLSSLDSSVAEVRRMLASRTSDKDKFGAVGMFIYEDGVWNGNHRFDYDLDDPTGANLRNQLLSTYLDTRKGNCVSMPTLFYALTQRLDPSFPVCGVAIPLHFFCRVKDRQTGDVWNFETTNGHTARNIWYIEQHNIPQKAIDSGIYMRELSRKEFLAGLMQVLIAKHREKKEFQIALKYTELVLKLNPKDIVAIVQKCALNSELGYQLYQKEQKGDTLTAKEKNLFEQYKATTIEFEKKAFSLGWKPETPEEREKYLQTVKEEKLKRSQQK